MFLTTFAVQLPVWVICLVAAVVVLVKWRQALRASIWALAGFGLTSILCFGIPLVQSRVQVWVMQSGDIAHRAWVLSRVSNLWSVLRSLTYVLLMVAILAERPPSRSESPPAF